MNPKTDAYIVPFAELKRAAGSGDQTLLRAISRECAGLLAEADDNREEDETLTCADALADLINGADLDEVEDSAYLYGLALEAMCAYFGEFVGDVYGRWNEELDAWFVAHGIPLRFTDLVCGSAVIDLPKFFGFPEIGSWSPDVVSAAAASLRTINLLGVLQMEKDDELAEVVGEVIKWVDQASQRPGWGIVGFSLEV